MTVVLEQVRRWSASGLDAVVVRLDTAAGRLGDLRDALDCAAGRLTRGAVPPRMRLAPSTSDWWHGAAAGGRGQRVRAGARRGRRRGRRDPCAGLAEAQDLADAQRAHDRGGRRRRRAACRPGTRRQRGRRCRPKSGTGVEQVLRAAAALDADLAALLAGRPSTNQASTRTRRAGRRGHHLRRARDRRARAAGRDARGQRRLVVRAVPGRAAAGRRRAPGVGRQPRRHPGRRPRRGEPGPPRRAGRPARRRPPAVQARYDALTAAGPGAVEAVWLARAQRPARPARRAAPAAAGARRRPDRDHRLRPSASCCSTSTGRARGPRSRSATSTPQNTSPCSPPDSAPPSGRTRRRGGHGGRAAWPVARRTGRRRPRRRVRRRGGLAGLRRAGRSARREHARTPPARGGADLARFYEGIDASRRADPHLTALGHSYGSLTTGYALQQAHGVDDAVLFGSPGLGTDHVDDLHVPPATPASSRPRGTRSRISGGSATTRTGSTA